MKACSKVSGLDYAPNTFLVKIYYCSPSDNTRNVTQIFLRPGLLRCVYRRQGAENKHSLNFIKSMKYNNKIWYSFNKMPSIDVFL